jgi:glutamate formiminotransferase/formiminotetrahydrofolate cyclodeaminase
VLFRSEGLAARIVTEKWAPDFGPAEFVPTFGATVTGARKFLIAYNVNILATKNQAHRIALNLRSRGRGPDKPGRLPEIKGMGWWLEEHKLAQITMNLSDWEVTPIHVAFEEACKDARELRVAAAGSELVGLVPLAAMLAAYDFYAEREGLFIMDETTKVRLVVDRLGLNSISPFIPEKRIIEYMIAQPRVEPLASLTVRGFIEEVGARTAAPGGGSVAGVIAALGAGLSTMVGWMTYGIRKFEAKDAEMRRLLPPLHAAMTDLIPLIDADTEAFNDYMDALRMPKGTDEEKAARQAALVAGLKTAAEVPLSVMRRVDATWPAVIDMAAHGNISSRSDLEVGAKSLETGCWGAHRNVLINLDNAVLAEEAAYKAEITAEAAAIMGRAEEACKRVCAVLAERAAAE